MSQIMVRAIAREDWNQWLPLWNGYKAFYGREGPTALLLEVTMMTWARFLMRMNPFTRSWQNAMESWSV